MNKYIILICCFTSIISCNSPQKKSQKTTGLPTINLNADLDEQKICLQDIATIEYIPLESKENNICTGVVSYMDDSIIVLTGGSVYKGAFTDILFFKRNGEFISKFNRQGEGPEEYIFVTSICYDKQKDELYVQNDAKRKFQIYNQKGNFIRSINYPKELDSEKHLSIPYFNNYSPDKLLCCIKTFINYEDETYDDKFEYILISKKTGEYIQKLKIEQEGYKTAHIVKYHDYTSYTITIPTFPMISTIDGYNIFDTASDYVYHIDNGMNLKPILKKEYSDDQSKDRICLMGGIETPQYLFMNKITKKEKEINMNNFNFDKDLTIDNFEFEDIVFNKLDNSYNKYFIYNNDWKSLKLYLTGQKARSFNTLPNTVIIWQQANNIKEAYNENKLEGELKEIATKLNEEDNPVLTVITFKEKSTK